MNKIIIEICSFSFEACQTAFKGHADRVELCDNPAEGGTTPSCGMIKAVREKIPVSLYTLIRPRAGDFCYSDEEFGIIKDDIAMCRELNCDGVTVGIQDLEGRIDKDRMKCVTELAWPMKVTCSRAFDLVPDPFEAIETLIDAGCARILTSGLANTAPEGSGLIKKLIDYAGGRITIMPGAGIRSSNFTMLAKETSAGEFHTSARVLLPNKTPSAGNTNIDKDFGQAVGCSLEEILKLRKLADSVVMNGSKTKNFL